MHNKQRISKKGWTALKSEDELIYYFKKDKQDKVYMLVYNLGTEMNLKYKQIFDMMAESFELL